MLGNKLTKKTKLSVISFLLITTILTAGVSASCVCTKTPLGSGTPPATQNLVCKCKCNCIDYTAVAASSCNPRIVQFKDLSKCNKESYIRWDFGDGTHIEGTKITSALKYPVHTYKKTGFYISCLTIRCSNCGRLCWVHKNVVIK